MVKLVSVFDNVETASLGDPFTETARREMARSPVSQRPMEEVLVGSASHKFAAYLDADNRLVLPKIRDKR